MRNEEINSEDLTQRRKDASDLWSANTKEEGLGNEEGRHAIRYYR